MEKWPRKAQDEPGTWEHFDITESIEVKNKQKKRDGNMFKEHRTSFKGSPVAKSGTIFELKINQDSKGL